MQKKVVTMYNVTLDGKTVADKITLQDFVVKFVTGKLFEQVKDYKLFEIK
jgi:hypothetical protein